jgi:hypothetical protein
MNASLLDNHHGPEVLIFSALISETRIPSGHHNVAMTQQQLQTFQAHTGIEQFTCKGMPEAVKRISFAPQPYFPQILCENISGRSVASVTPQAIKEIFFTLISFAKPKL